MPISAKDLNLLEDQLRVFNYRNLKRLDWLLLLVTVALASIGLLVLYSASTTGSTAWWATQALHMSVGLLALLILACIDYRFLVSMAPLFYVAAIALLVLVLAIGVEVKGAKRWLTLGPMGTLQPSEIAKVAVIYGLAWYLALIKERVRSFPFLCLSFLIAGLPAALVMKQPNLSTAITFVPIVLVMVYVAGCRLWHLVLLALIGAALSPIMYTRLNEYQRNRVKVFLHIRDKADQAEDVEADAEAEAAKREREFRLGSGWHSIQTVITVGSGQLQGKGYLQGTQTHLRFLPEHHTDFIFSLLAEEKGFIGGVVVIGLFAVFLLRGLALARDCPEPSGTLLAAGTVTILGFHVFINIAVTTGLVPVTGLPLPFLSYGGTFCLATMVLVGTLLSVHVRKGLFL